MTVPCDQGPLTGICVCGHARNTIPDGRSPAIGHEQCSVGGRPWTPPNANIRRPARSCGATVDLRDVGLDLWSCRPSRRDVQTFLRLRLPGGDLDARTDWMFGSTGGWYDGVSANGLAEARALAAEDRRRQPCDRTPLDRWLVGVSASDAPAADRRGRRKATLQSSRTATPDQIGRRTWPSPVEHCVDVGSACDKPHLHRSIWSAVAPPRVLRIVVEFTELGCEHVDQRSRFAPMRRPRLALGDQLFCCRHRGLLHVGSQCGSKIDKPVHRCDADSQNIRENRHQPPLVQSCRSSARSPHQRIASRSPGHSRTARTSAGPRYWRRAHISCSSITVRSSSR